VCACRLIIRNCLIRENDHPGIVFPGNSPIRENDYPGNDFPGNVFPGKKPSGKVTIRETTVNHMNDVCGRPLKSLKPIALNEHVEKKYAKT